MVDPAIMGSGGFVSVTRMTGTGPVLLIVPEGGLQAWRRMYEASGGQFFEATTHSRAYADDEWKNSGTPFVAPSSVVVPPGGSLEFAYQLVLASSLRQKDAALAAIGAPVVQAVPSLAIATDMANASLLFLPPRGAQISKVRRPRAQTHFCRPLEH